MDLTLEQLQEFQAFQSFKAQKSGALNGGHLMRPAMKAKSFRVYQGARELARGTGRKALPDGSPEGPYISGPGGIFGIGYSLQQDVLSTRLEPKGLLAELPWYPSIDDNPIWAYLTGWTNPAYTPPVGVCDVPTAPGNAKTCTVSFPFGRYTFRTREVEANRMGRRINRGEARDLRFVNDPLSGVLADLLGFGSGADAVLQGNEMASRFLDAGIQAQNILSPQTYTGDPANGNGGGYAEMIGLDLSIKTGITDYLQPATACPSMDSIVVDFENEKIDDPTQDIVGLFAAIMNEIISRAEMMNFNINWENREEFSIEMPRVLFWALTLIWPCGYMTNGCAALAGDLVGIDATDQTTMRDTMRTGKFLWINGLRINVVVDDGITETAGDGDPIDLGCFGSNVYFTTRRVNGGVETLYVEYADYSETVRQVVDTGHYFNIWSDNGIFLWTSVPNVVWCLAAVGKVEPRLVNLVPFLDAKILNVQYCPDARVVNRRALPSNPGYVNGGVEDGRETPFPPINMLLCNPPDGQDDVLYVDYTFTATGGTAPYTWFGAGLPTGLSLHAVTGVLSGTPTAAATFNPVISVVDDNGLIANCQPSIVIAPA